MAGFFDAEGSVDIKRNHVRVGQKDRGILEMIQSKFGGKIYYQSRCGCWMLCWYKRSIVVDCYNV